MRETLAPWQSPTRLVSCHRCGRAGKVPGDRQAAECHHHPFGHRRLYFCSTQCDAWHDFWIGAFWDKPRRRLYIFPFPCFGVRVDFRPFEEANRD